MRVTALLLGLLGSTALATAASAQNALPSFIVSGTVSATDYDGVSDDLLTGGFGATAIGGTALPTVADALNPTGAELRRRAIVNAYRGLMDTSANGGWKVLFGPNLDASYNSTRGEGLVAGREYVALADDGTGSNYQTMMVQIPTSFDRTRPCLITGPSSGSRNHYGAVGTTAEWAFRNGCAMTYTDKGTGNAYNDLTAGTVYNKVGQRVASATAGGNTNFRAPDTGGLTDFAQANPNRLAYKQAHSTKNVDGRWGDYTLQSISFGLWALNDYLAGGASTYTSANTAVIAAGVSNGGGAAIQAAERDTTGLIDGVVAVYPNVIPTNNASVSVVYGGQTQAAGKHFIDYYSFLALYAPCASLDGSLTGFPLQSAEPNGTAAGVSVRANRCQSLRDRGLLTTDGTANQAAEALSRIYAYGILPESSFTLPFMEWASGYRQIINTYIAGYGRFGVQEDVCGTSFAATDSNGRPTVLPAATAAVLFAAGNILPPAGGINVIADRAVNSPIIEQNAISASTRRQDLNYDGAQCYRDLVTATAADRTGFRPALNLNRVSQGMGEVTSSGLLRGKPALIVQGRNDEVIHPNHAGRYYLGLSRLVEGGASRLSYIEVTNGQHFESLISTTFLQNGGAVYMPVIYYFHKALDAMLANLRIGTALPPSQVVRTTARGTTPITTANAATLMPAIAMSPAAGDLITYVNGTVGIPR